MSPAILLVHGVPEMSPAILHVPGPEQGIKLLGLLLTGSTGQHMASRNGLAWHTLPRFRIERKFDSCDCNVTSF